MADESNDAPITNEEAIEMLRAGKVEAWNTLRNKHPTWDPDLSLADFCGSKRRPGEPLVIIDFKVPQHKPNLSGVDFRGAKLIGAKLFNADLVEADFSGANLSEASLVGADFSNANLREAVLRGANLTGANLSCASLILTDLCGAKLSRANLQAADVYSTCLRGTHGLFGDATAINQDQIVNVENTIFHQHLDYIKWSLLRTIGQLRLFGVSYLTVILLTLYITFVHWYNDGLFGLAQWAEQTMADGGPSWIEWLTKLPPLPIPVSLGFQLAAIIALAIASTIFKLRCPSIVQEQSEVGWERVTKNPLLEYRSADWCRLKWRYTCAFFFVLGSLYTLYFIGLRIISAFAYAFSAWF